MVSENSGLLVVIESASPAATSSGMPYVRPGTRPRDSDPPAASASLGLPSPGRASRPRRGGGPAQGAAPAAGRPVEVDLFEQVAQFLGQLVGRLAGEGDRDQA